MIVLFSFSIDSSGLLVIRDELEFSKGEEQHFFLGIGRRRVCMKKRLTESANVVGPWYCGPDPDPRIRASGQRIRIPLVFFLDLLDANKKVCLLITF
jgi:hypothetical protein